MKTNLRAAALAVLVLSLAPLSPAGEPAANRPRRDAPAERSGGGRGEVRMPPPAARTEVPAEPWTLLLARPTDRSITVSILSAAEREGYVEFGLAPGPLARRTPARRFPAGEPVTLLLDGLAPGAKHQYRFVSRDAAGTELASPVHSFTTARPSGAPFVFTVQADSHLDLGVDTGAYRKSILHAVAGGTDFHVDIGDTFMTDKYPNFKDSLPQYLAQRYYLGQMSHSSPLFLVLGNYDGERLDRYDGKADSMPVWSCLNRKKYFPNPYPDGFYTGNKEELKPIGKLENYYAFEWGDAQFIALDPFWNTKRNRGKTDEGNWSRTLGETQFKWLEKTLASSKAKYKFVFIHHLVGGLDESARGGSEAAVLYEWGGKNKEGQDEFKARRPGWSMPIHSLFVKHKVSVVFHGHDHFFAKQDLDKVVYLMVPQPGHPGSERLKNVDEYGYVRGDFLSPAGHIRVSVSAEMAKIDYVRSVLPQSETSERKNKAVAYSFKISP